MARQDAASFAVRYRAFRMIGCKWPFDHNIIGSPVTTNGNNETIRRTLLLVRARLVNLPQRSLRPESDRNLRRYQTTQCAIPEVARVAV
jgi:hypothetical protein